MLECDDRIDVSESINTNISSRECIICHYWCFFKTNFGFQLKVCDGYHMTKKSMRFDDFAIVMVGRNGFRINFWFMTKSEVWIE